MRKRSAQVYSSPELLNTQRMQFGGQVERYRSRVPRQLVDWLRFNVVGIIGVGVQLTILAFLRSGLEWSVAWSTVVAVECTVIHNFVWHEHWTWAYRKLHIREMPGRLLRFNLSNGLISIVGNLVLMQILAVRLHLNYMVANLIAILVCSLVNFLVSDKLVFRRPSGLT